MCRKRTILLLLLGLFSISTINIFAQELEQDLSYNIQYQGDYSKKQDIEATKLLYKEINIYRANNNVIPCVIDPTPVKYSCRWGNYMVSKDGGPHKIFYEHSKFGPDSLHIPGYCSEIIHLIYFEHRPTAIEIVHGLMYGVPRSGGNVVGWTRSEGHNEVLLQKSVKYYGVSIYVIKSGPFCAVYGTVNFSTVK